MIIGTGFQKTGTSSLREALKILGYRVKDTSHRPLIPILKGDFDTVLKMLEGYDAVEDTPWYRIYRELDRLIPGSKFIHTIRNEESWYNSVSRHIGYLRNPMHEWIYGRGKGLPKDHRENTISVYQKHNQEVLEYFSDRPGDLLVMDFSTGAGWKELCGFLDLPVPEEPFPHANRYDTEKSPSKLDQGRGFKYRRKQLKYKVKIKYIDWKGFW
jgi:hypothetical protein